jgi:hypothetical protein
MALLKASLKALQRRGELVCDDIDVLASLVDAMICKLVLQIPEAHDPHKVRAEGKKIIMRLLQALRR